MAAGRIGGTRMRRVLPATGRRKLIKAIAAGAFVTALGGCVSRPSASRWPRSYSRNPWTAPAISMENVIRVVVGHRPFRPSGFRVETERFDDKTVVHNYGHGGGGLSICWGTAALAVRETLGMVQGDVAVIGSGIIGLTTARLLQDAGWNATIYTRDVARHTTSNVAAGEWGPFSVHDPSVSSPAFRSKLEWAARISHHALTNLGAAYGIRWMELYTLADAAGGGEDGPFADLYPHRAVLSPGEHPFAAPYARRSLTMQISPGVLLRQLTRDFLLAGGKIVVREFTDVPDVLSLPQSLVFNCTGLGAARLFGDTELVPAKGQLVFFPPDPTVDYMTIGGGPGLLYMFPRADVVLLGGTFKLGDYTTHPEPEETARIVAAHQRLFENLAQLRGSAAARG